MSRLNKLSGLQSVYAAARIAQSQHTSNMIDKLYDRSVPLLIIEIL